MINIVIPMAGAGSRFANEGYKDPKPLIQIGEVPMIRVVINNLRPRFNHRFIFICQQSHIEEYGLREKLSSWSPNCEVIGLSGITEGAACTVLAARNLIDNHKPLMIANSDQYVDIDINLYLKNIDEKKLDGLIMTMGASDPKWSYVGLNASGHVERVVEKVVISNEATVGIYNFVRGRDFVKAADSMIASNLRVNNEFYVAPTYNQLINNGQTVGIFNVGKERDGMYGLGIPSDLNYFINHPIHIKATECCDTQ
jgi:NDP-sugar pyrophosphorylase family protein